MQYCFFICIRYSYSTVIHISMLPNTLVYPNMFKCFMKSKYYYTYVNKDIIHILDLDKAGQLR